VKSAAKRYTDGKQYYQSVMLPEKTDGKPADAKPAEKPAATKPAAAKPAEKPAATKP
jgi:hypothetical protein